MRSTSSSLEVEAPSPRRRKKKVEEEEEEGEQIIQKGTNNAVRVSSGIDLVGKKALRRSMRRRQGTQTGKLMCSPNVFKPEERRTGKKKR